ncbi:MAG: hypothetical protein BM556_07270 [Bacteriovorax sp. MedPE-SWde]|nr:MAG: hypothetical protein BM556_07270 [Bacteriovorax sp. MedPE-SWde]
MHIFLSDKEGNLELLSGNCELKTVEELQKKYSDNLISVIEMPDTEKRLIVLETIGSRGGLEDCLSEIRHEIANPLNLIKVMVHIIHEGTVDGKKANELLGNIEKNIDKITDILSSLTDKYVDEDDQVNKIHVNDFIDSILDMFRYVFKDSNVLLDIRKSREVSLCNIHSVGTTLTQAIFNLIKNSFHILKKSNQELKIVKLVFERVDNKLHITIEDNGPGFSERAMESIFYKNITTNTEEDGHGLGLQLVREYIQKNKGEINLDTSFKAGARFKIKLPVEGVEKKSILIIDDIEDILSSIQTTLGEQYEVKACSNTKVAYQYLLTHNVDLIISDLRMPEESGLDFYKKSSREFPTIPFILFTAYPNAVVGEEMEKNKSGFRLVSKPHLDELEDEVEKIFKVAS